MRGVTNPQKEGPKAYNNSLKYIAFFVFSPHDVRGAVRRQTFEHSGRLARRALPG
jgi:hypothetical protein